jgi:peptide/nickel transport system permease protein
MSASTLTVPRSNTSTPAIGKRPKRRWRRFQEWSLVTGLVCVTLLVGAAVCAPALAAFDPLRVDTANLLEPPSGGHWLGTDDLGRDVWSRVLFGGRTSLSIGVAATLLATALGVVVALVAGYWGGRLDGFLMRVMDAFLAFPGLVLALAMVSFLGPSALTIVLAIGIVAAPGTARISRGQILVDRRLQFVEAAIVTGATHMRIIVRHLLPNLAPLIAVQASLNLAFAILTEGSLSFLGAGVPPPAPTWGAMLQKGYPYLDSAPWVAIVPGAAVFLTVLGFNLLGDGLRAVLSPRRG